MSSSRYHHPQLHQNYQKEQLQILLFLYKGVLRGKVSGRGRGFLPCFIMSPKNGDNCNSWSRVDFGFLSYGRKITMLCVIDHPKNGWIRGKNRSSWHNFLVTPAKNCARNPAKDFAKTNKLCVMPISGRKRRSSRTDFKSYGVSYKIVCQKLC